MSPRNLVRKNREDGSFLQGFLLPAGHTIALCVRHWRGKKMQYKSI